MTRIAIRFDPIGREVEVEEGTTLHAAALTAEIPLDAPCGGAGLCRGCRVRAEGALSPLDDRERSRLSESELDDGYRLACVAAAEGPVVVTLSPAVARRVEARPAGGPGRAEGRCAVAVDVGTTTLSVALVDATTGDEIDCVSAPNPQVAFGADVMTRISRASDDLEPMRTVLLDALCEAIDAVAARDASGSSLEAVAIAGNAAMTHILAGVDPSGLGVAPFEPVFLGERSLDGALLGLEPGVPATILPGISSFVGADVVAGALATRMLERGGATLLIDVGTNAEVLLKDGFDGFWATSAAAGPALEGGGITSGMRAVEGAIERVGVRNGVLDLTVIGGGQPQGLCGSGLVDLVSVLLAAGVLDRSGRLVDGGVPSLAARVSTGESRVFDVARGVRLTQQDVRQVQLAKGAIAAAHGILLADRNLAADDIDEVLIAGEFGYHLDPDALVALGVVPAAWRERVTFVGNASKAGVARWLVEASARDDARRIIERARVVELPTHTGFQDRFVAELDFPPAGTWRTKTHRPEGIASLKANETGGHQSPDRGNRESDS